MNDTETSIRAIDAYDLQRKILEEFVKHSTIADRERIQTALDIMRIVDRCQTIPVCLPVCKDKKEAATID